MNVKIMKYTRDDEILSSLHFYDDHNNDYLVMPFYVNSEVLRAEKNLKMAINGLPDLIQMIYDAGKNGQELNMQVTEIPI